MFPDEKQFRELIVWLEDQKIRFLKVDDRSDLRNIDDRNWGKTYREYLNYLECPITSGIQREELEWLLSFSVSLVYKDTKQSTPTPEPCPTNPLNKLNFQSPELIEGVNKLAALFDIIPPKDHLMTLKAVASIVTKRLAAGAIQDPASVVTQGEAIPLAEVHSGFELGDPVLDQAAKILRLLFIHDLRKLQTNINECIVGIQSLTANPKTDTKLGKVGI